VNSLPLYGQAAHSLNDSEKDGKERDKEWENSRHSRLRWRRYDSGIEVPTPVMLVVAMRWRMAEEVERDISALFHPLCRKRERRRGTERSWKDGERGMLNYNSLRDTAEFAFKIKRT